MRKLIIKYRCVFILGILMALSIFGSVMVIMRHMRIQETGYYYLIWNLFLAWIPLVIAFMMFLAVKLHNNKIKFIFLSVAGCMWLLFYPNAPYMITDFIHFSYKGEILLTWYDLIMFSIFNITAFLIGFISLYLVSKIVEKIYNTLASFILTIFVLILTGYGIYIGRIVRWNSWDIISDPLSLIRSMIENLNYTSIMFTFIFSMFLILVYSLLYVLTFFEIKEN